MKICNRCKVEKPLDAFGFRKSVKSNINGICKQCRVEVGQLRRYGMTTQVALGYTSNCHLCGIDLMTGKTCIDHDHQTGLVRGIICSKCNLGIAMLGDNLEGVQKAVAYLSSPPMLPHNIKYLN